MLICGDARSLPLKDNLVDAVVTDPPYNLISKERRNARRATPRESSQNKTRGFMGMKWDGSGVAFDSGMWLEVMRVMKPGAHLVSFGGSRTFHRVACAIEDAGFELRDMLMWIYGSGWPKSLDVSKAIDKAAGVPGVPVNTEDRQTQNTLEGGVLKNRCQICGKPFFSANPCRCSKSIPITDDARQWSGWGTSLKPAYEPIILARKPLSESTVAKNVLKWGTGAINVNECRIPVLDQEYKRNCSGDRGHKSNRKRRTDYGMTAGSASNIGRWPTNVLLDEESAALMDEQSGNLTSGANPTRRNTDKFRRIYSAFEGSECIVHRGQNSGGASRFFYTSKASSAERGEGNTHPTVKPVDLMQWLCKLITPPGGLILDCFYGSGSTGIAAVNAGFRIMGMDLEYHEISRKRLYGPLFSRVVNSES